MWRWSPQRRWCTTQVQNNKLSFRQVLMEDFTCGVSYGKLWQTNKHTHVWQTSFRSSFLPLLPSPAWPWSCSEPPVNINGPRTPRISPGATEWESKSCWMTLDHLYTRTSWAPVTSMRPAPALDHHWVAPSLPSPKYPGSLPGSAARDALNQYVHRRFWAGAWIRHSPGYSWSINQSMFQWIGLV